MRLFPVLPTIGLVLLGGLAPSAADPAAKPVTVPVDPKLKAVRPWIEHKDWSVRALAAFELRTRSEPGAVWLATRMLSREENPYAAAMALGVLDGRPRAELVAEGGPPLPDAVLRLLEHAHPIVRSRALRVIQALPPVKLGDDPAAYRSWWTMGRQQLAIEQRRILTALAKAGETKAAQPLAPSTSFESSADDRFYGQIERLRRDGLELCIVMDHTGSMAPVIGAAKAQAVSLLRRLRKYVPSFRAGLVTYDDGARLRLPLTQNEATLKKAFRRVGAGGGADWEEGVDQGIYLALKQEMLGWSRKAQRVLVVVGDAPPHLNDVPRLLRRIQAARVDDMFDQPVIVHTVSTAASRVDFFPQIAKAGHGQHVTLRSTGQLVEELVLLTFGGEYRDRIRAWMAAMDKLRAAERE